MVFWCHKCHLVLLSMCCHPRWPALKVGAEIVSYINSSFLAKFRFPVSEYTRCNAVENSHIHKVIGSVRPSNYRESASSPITKASNISNFHIPLVFCSLLSQPCSIRYFFSLFDTSSHLRNLKENMLRIESLYPKDSNMFRQLNKVKPRSVWLVLGWVTTCEYSLW